VREVLGAGTITLFPVGAFDGTISIPGIVDSPARVMALPAGALLAIGFLMAGFNALKARLDAKAARREAAAAKGEPEAA
jgi:electron transport complex protein RnfE